VRAAIKILFIVTLIQICFFNSIVVYSQPNISDFDKYYKQGLNLVINDISGARQILGQLESQQSKFTPAEKAKTNFLRLRIISRDPDLLASLEKKMFSPPDSLNLIDAMTFTASRYLEKSMPDKAVTLLMNILDSVKKESDQAHKCLIYLTEAYREKQEYVKGIDILNNLLSTGKHFSDLNRAFAYNRLAALYAEWMNPEINYPDSVIKYSLKCINLSERIRSSSNLGFAQNELSYQYRVKKQWEKALDLSRKSVENFKESGMNFSAMNALINQSNIYVGMGKTEIALHTILEATDLCKIEENRNLFMRIYFHIANIYKQIGNYKDAFDFLIIANELQSDFYRDRINAQIVEKSAKYDLLIKEQRIKEEKQKNDFKQKQIAFLIIILIFLSIAFIVSVFYLRLKRKDLLKQQLIEAVVEAEANERKRIARDLHDGLGPVISALNHYFQAYIDCAEADKESIQVKMQQVISGAIDEISRISHNISPHILEKHGMNMALNNFIAPIVSGSIIKIEYTSEYLNRFELKKELTIYRCITELIHNTLKHARASLIFLHITCREKTLFVFYSDNGKGFEGNPGANHGMGLMNIRNRIEMFGGKLFIESSLNNGIKVNIELPL
jgi:signal transduction histidine kinase